MMGCLEGMTSKEAEYYDFSAVQVVMLFNFLGLLALYS